MSRSWCWRSCLIEKALRWNIGLEVSWHKVHSFSSCCLRHQINRNSCFPIRTQHQERVDVKPPLSTYCAICLLFCKTIILVDPPTKPFLFFHNVQIRVALSDTASGAKFYTHTIADMGSLADSNQCQAYFEFSSHSFGHILRLRGRIRAIPEMFCVWELA